MPRPEPVEEWTQVSFPELVVKIGGGTSFSVDQLVGMLANAEKKGEDFRIVHTGIRFIVPLALIQDYFSDHQRPTPKMSAKEELEYLRRRVSELEEERSAAQAEMKPHPDMPRRERETPAPTPPNRDEGIPTAERMSLEQIREELKKDVETAAPLTRQSKPVKRAREEAGL